MTAPNCAGARRVSNLSSRSAGSGRDAAHLHAVVTRAVRRKRSSGEEQLERGGQGLDDEVEGGEDGSRRELCSLLSAGRGCCCSPGQVRTSRDVDHQEPTFLSDVDPALPQSECLSPSPAYL